MALTNNDIRIFVDSMIRKETEGNSYTIRQFNNWLRVSSWERFVEEYSNNEIDQEDNDSLRPFISTASITLSAGSSTSGFPSNYYHAKTVYTSASKKVDILSDGEWEDRENCSITGPSADYPIVRFTSSGMDILPTSITSATLRYLKVPTDPNFDYYQDANGVIQYLAVGAQHTLLANEVYSDGTTSGTKTSTSVELEWNDDDKIKIAYLILQKAGVNLPNNPSAQFALNKNIELTKQ